MFEFMVKLDWVRELRERVVGWSQPVKVVVLAVIRSSYVHCGWVKT